MVAPALRRVGRRQGRRFTAVRRHAPQSGPWVVCGEHDRVVVAPARAERRSGDRAERDGRSPGDRHLLELRGREEPNPPTIGGKEHPECADAGELARVELIDRAHHQRCADGRRPATGAVDEVPAVRREGEVAIVEPDTFSGWSGDGTIAKRDDRTGACGAGRIRIHATSAAIDRAAGQRRDRHRRDATGRRRRECERLGGRRRDRVVDLQSSTGRRIEPSLAILFQTPSQ